VYRVLVVYVLCGVMSVCEIDVLNLYGYAKDMYGYVLYILCAEPEVCLN
jgi:hypothetical protein